MRQVFFIKHRKSLAATFLIEAPLFLASHSPTPSMCPCGGLRENRRGVVPGLQAAVPMMQGHRS